ncbi:hypothetical protein GCM10017783_26280 [Deinococcus piscis]|uniref:Glycoside-hydrolase family GH114 TIM-barrel domain-containing protein n=1 Tax=Deinococcus piscis TaxID=394230 RepID=A0ABQ3KC22_9DEIO|nr:endo alpha-1,4 polygalactosaminidase [Deinococcus piscis]GHG13466.1 hypothetical protein GCM10017783_26280 [Deinococcus piscis]
MQGHMTEAASIGCDALEPDNIDIYAQEELADLGITSEMQYAYNTWLAEAAHEMNQKIYLKNDLDQIADGGEEVPEGERGLAYIFDGLINESCFTYTECEKASPFRDQGKPIFVREYNVADCTAFRRKQIEYKTGYKSIQQIANELHLNVSASRYENGGNPDTGGRDANAYAPLCTFGTW